MANSNEAQIRDLQDRLSLIDDAEAEISKAMYKINRATFNKPEMRAMVEKGMLKLDELMDNKPSFGLLSWIRDALEGEIKKLSNKTAGTDGTK